MTVLQTAHPSLDERAEYGRRAQVRRRDELDHAEFAGAVRSGRLQAIEKSEPTGATDEKAIMTTGILPVLATAEDRCTAPYEIEGVGGDRPTATSGARLQGRTTGAAR